MNQGRLEVRQLWVLAAMVLLLAGSAGATLGVGDSAASPAADPEKSDVGGGGGSGCCARATSDEQGPRCRRAGEGGCCSREARSGHGQGHGRGPGGGGPAAGRGSGHGARSGAGRVAGRGAGQSGGPAVMETAMVLVHDYRQVIERRVEEIENGVVTVTRAPSSAEASQAIERHVREMKNVLESGGRVRVWDPLFREIFDHADKITMEIEELEDGMRVTETSDDPEVVKLIQAHAHKVTEFLDRGPAAVHEETPLPKGYAAAD